MSYNYSGVRIPNESQSGFTLVEISIVMIIIGLLIGGTFGGMKLIENMQINKTVQDIKAIESSTLTFRDTFGRLPGDLVNPSARLSNCTVAPCATGGNGNRLIDNSSSYDEAVSAAQERFTFWHQLQASDLASFGTNNTTNLSFGDGQPEAPVGGGYRLTNLTGWVWIIGTTLPYRGTSLIIGLTDSAAITLAPTQVSVPCITLSRIDQKIDDGLVFNGQTGSWNCGTPIAPTTTYNQMSAISAMWYDLKGF